VLGSQLYGGKDVLRAAVASSRRRSGSCMGKLPQYARRRGPMCVGQSRLCLVSVHASDSSLLSPAAENQLPAPPAISLSHALSRNGVLQSRFVIIGTHQSKGWDWNWTIADELPTREIRTYALICPPAPLICERGIMTRHQDSSSVRWSRHPQPRSREGQMGMTPL
jgi:hypothetical protein